MSFSLKHSFRQIKKFPGWIYYLPSRLLLLFRILMRHQVIDPGGLIEKYSNGCGTAVTVTWHNRLLFFPAMFPRKVRERTVAVISASRDGQYIADLCLQFGVRSVRGSSSRKAVSVLYHAIKTIQNGSLVSFTPDGPRGPVYVMNKGPVHMASQLGVPVIPIAVNYSSYWELGGWDRFQIPKPWAKITLVMGDEIYVPANLSASELEEWRLKIQEKLCEISGVSPEKIK